MMRFAICDDDALLCSQLETRLRSSCFAPLEVEVFGNGEDFLAAVHAGTYYDAVFLDMEMPGKNGLETANALRVWDEHVEIIFVTSHSDYMAESFKCAPLRFLLKPLDEEKLAEAIIALAQKLNKKATPIILKAGVSTLQLHPDDIMYTETKGHYTTVVTKNNSYRLRMTFATLREQLDSALFGRPYNTFLVNFSWVTFASSDYVLLRGMDARIPLSRSYKKSFSEGFTEYLERKIGL